MIPQIQKNAIPPPWLFFRNRFQVAWQKAPVRTRAKARSDKAERRRAAWFVFMDGANSKGGLSASLGMYHARSSNQGMRSRCNSGGLQIIEMLLPSTRTFS